MMNFWATIVLTTQLTLSGQFHDGLKALEAQKYDEAIASLTQVIENKDDGNSFREFTLFYRGEANRGKGQKDKALADYAAVLNQTKQASLSKASLAGYKAAGGDPKKLLPQETPTMVFEKTIALAKKGDLDGLLALCTGAWREKTMKEMEGNRERFKENIADQADDTVVSAERIGKDKEAGKAWLEVSDRGGEKVGTMEFTLDTENNVWLISNFFEKGEKEGEKPLKAEEKASPEPKKEAVVEEKPEVMRKRLRQLSLDIWLMSSDNIQVSNFTEGHKEEIIKSIQRLSSKNPEVRKKAEEILIGEGKGWRTVVEAHRTYSKNPFEFNKDEETETPSEPNKEALTKEMQEEVRKLVQQLGSNKFEARKEAWAKLKAMGDNIRPVLEEYRNHTDPEIRLTIRELLGGN